MSPATHIIPIRPCGGFYARGFAPVFVMFLTLWAGACVLFGQVTVTLGNHNVPQGATAYQIPVLISGGAPITDLVGIFQVGNGGPSVGGTAGPEIASVSYFPSVWTSAAGGFESFSGSDTQIMESSVSLNVSGQTVTSSGTLVTLTIDAGNFPVGSKFDLKMTDTVLGDSSFYNGPSLVPFTAAKGTITIVDPSAAVPVTLPVVTLLRQPNQTIKLFFVGENGLSYRIWWNDDLTAPWTQVPGTIPGSGTLIEWTDDGSETGVSPALEPKRFYRVEVFTSPVTAALVPVPTISLLPESGGDMKVFFGAQAVCIAGLHGMTFWSRHGPAFPERSRAAQPSSNGAKMAPGPASPRQRS